MFFFILYYIKKKLFFNSNFKKKQKMEGVKFIKNIIISLSKEDIKDQIDIDITIILKEYQQCRNIPETYTKLIALGVTFYHL